jgi:hypothetical protein
MDGHPLADALINPPPGSAQAQASLAGSLTQIVTAMSANSAADRRAGG